MERRPLPKRFRGAPDFAPEMTIAELADYHNALAGRRPKSVITQYESKYPHLKENPNTLLPNAVAEAVKEERNAAIQAAKEGALPPPDVAPAEEKPVVVSETMDLADKRRAALAKAREVKAAKREAAKSASVKEAEEQLKAMGAPKPKKARKPRAKKAEMDPEERKEAKKALQERMKAAEKKEEPKKEAPKSESPKEEAPKDEKKTIASIRDEVRKLRKIHCPSIAKMRRPALLKESRRHLRSAGESAEAIDDMNLESKSISDLRLGLKALREEHCPPVGKMRKPKLLEELEKLKGMSKANPENEDEKKKND